MMATNELKIIHSTLLVLCVWGGGGGVCVCINKKKLQMNTITQNVSHCSNKKCDCVFITIIIYLNKYITCLPKQN